MPHPKEKITLKEAREKGKLDEFIKEHEVDADGDADKLDATLQSAIRGQNKSIQGKSKSVPKTSSQEPDESCNDTQTPSRS